MSIAEAQATHMAPEIELANTVEQPEHNNISQSTDSMVTVRLSDVQSSATSVEPAELDLQQQGMDLVAKEVKDTQELKSTTIAMELHAVEDKAGDLLDSTFEDSTYSKHDSEEIFSPVTNSSNRSRRSSSSTTSTEGSTRVDWEELERTEEQEPRDEGSDEVGSGHLYQTVKVTVALTIVVHCIPSCSA